MTCPICASETNPAFRPFCSRRCADIDLAKWLGGAYAIPSTSPEDQQEAIEALRRALVVEPGRPH